MKLSSAIQLVQFPGNPRVYCLWTDQLYVIYNLKESSIRLATAGEIASMHGLKAVEPDTIIDGNGRVNPNGGLFKASDLLARLEKNKESLADPFAWKEYITDWMAQPNMFSAHQQGHARGGRTKELVIQG